MQGHAGCCGPATETVTVHIASNCIRATAAQQGQLRHQHQELSFGQPLAPLAVGGLQVAQEADSPGRQHGEYQHAIQEGALDEHAGQDVHAGC